VVHARPVYRPGLRRRVGHTYELASLILRSGLFASGSQTRIHRHVETLRHWGTTLAGLAAAAAERGPDKPIVYDDRGVLTAGELHERVNRLAAGLPLDGPRPRVGILCRNHRGMVEALIAAGTCGAETVLLNTGFGAGQLRGVLSELRVDVLVADAEFAPLLALVPPALRRQVVWADSAGGEGPTLGQIIEATPYRRFEPPAVQGRTIVLSSGTTGRPKGARRPPRPGLGPLASLWSRIPFHTRDTVIIEAPIFHTWGFAAMQIALGMRCPIVLHRRFGPEATLHAIAGHRRPVLFAVPVMLQRIMELPDEVLRRYDASALRIAAVSGAAMPGDLATRFMDSFGDVLYNVYGSTEASWVSIATPRDLRVHPGTAGRPPRNTSLAILDDDGRPVPRGEIGRIFAANEMLFEGYTSGEPTEAWEGLLNTGDLGHVDRAGLLYVDGRADGLVVSGGENVVPRDVEDVLARISGVREVAVIGVPDEEYGQRLAAYLVLDPGARLTADSVRDHVRDQLARFAAPRDVHFIAELPRNATGKVVPRRLRGLEGGQTRRAPSGSWIRTSEPA
jgi:acyl-CoA synthetase (AMP-forming)/AMP-acid ligase II